MIEVRDASHDEVLVVGQQAKQRHQRNRVGTADSATSTRRRRR